MYRALVANELARGDLFELPLAGFPLEHPLNLIYLKESSFAAEFGPLRRPPGKCWEIKFWLSLGTNGGQVRLRSVS